MPNTKISSKGQVVIPKSIREKRKWRPGTKLAVEETAEGVLIRPNLFGKPLAVEEVQGSLPYDGKAKSIEEMDEAISKGVTKKYS